MPLGCPLGLVDGGEVGCNEIGFPVGNGVGFKVKVGVVVGLVVGPNVGEELGLDVASVLLQLQLTWKSNQPKGPLPALAALYSST